MRLYPTALVLCGGLSLTGCLAGRGDTDLLHARLREQEQRLAEVQSQLTAQERALAEARREADSLRKQLAQADGGGLLPEQTDQLVRVSGIKINSLLTAGVDRDEVAGDDALFVQFAPHDADGEIVKLPGAIDIAVLDPSLPDGERTVAQWSFAAEDCRAHWTRGFVGTGYQFTLPWPHEPPRNSELVVHVRLKPVDGREFTAAHVIRVTPPVVTAGSQQTVLKAGGRTEREPLAESTNWTEFTTPVRR
jgi:hypothetical protein